MQVVLVMFKADGERRSIPLNREMTVIGRHNDCDLRIPVGQVSRKHCRIVKEPDAVRIEDLGSSNGTYRNGQRVQESALEPGDYIQIGPAQFVVQIDGVPADEDISLPPTAATDEPELTPGEAFDPMSALLGEGGDSGADVDLGGDADDSAAGGEVV
ncbi:MAG TPA: FHA domain-containing protein [Tepidisphaeraceae bacterium]|nr:FHA domain-containing protein [Tepidisphaeraceae bacterium]